MAKEPELVLRRHADGTLYVRPYLGTNRVTGRQMRPYHRLRSTDEAEAMAEARAWLATVTGDPRLGEALARYVDGLEGLGRPKNTVRAYRTYAGRYVGPRMGQARVSQVTAADLTDLYRELLAHGARDGGPLAPATVIATHFFLRGAWAQFVVDGTAASNPVAWAVKPDPEEVEARPLARAQLQAVDEWSRELAGGQDPRRRALGMAVALGLAFGLRVGEACGLRARDVRELQGDLLVSGTAVEYRGRAERQGKTKGKRSRSVALTDGARETLAAYRAACGSGGLALPDDGPLVTHDGGWERPSEVSRAFGEAARGELGLPDWVHFHTLRHTHASWLLASGMDLRTVAERMGHASPQTTLAIYAHVLPGRDREAARTFAGVLAG